VVVSGGDVDGWGVDVRGGLTRRMVVASGLLALVLAAAFAMLLISIADLRTATSRARHSEEVLAAVNELERLVIDVETGLRGFVITGEERFLQPWVTAQSSFPEQARTLEHLVVDNPEQRRLARRIAESGTSYIHDYSVPLVDAARHDEASAESTATTAEGKRLVDAMRAQFDRFVSTERDLSTTRQQVSAEAARRAIIAGVAGLVGSIVLILLFAGYLTREIVRPVRRAALMAGRLAGGDLEARMPENGAGEVGELERSFNTMASSLEESRAALAASRARIVAASDETRRWIERDLHDGTQQRLVSLGLELRAAEFEVPAELAEVKRQMFRVAEGLEGALDDLREISRGIHPAILSQGGLGPAIKSLARRSTIRVELDLRTEGRLPERVEVAAYYVVSEALANAAKHARASAVHIDLETRDDALHLAVRDDGIGGADLARGSGLIGLTDRVETLGGTIAITSPIGEGTTMVVELPLGTD
jgi:signal transduction histidine kinase